MLLQIRESSASLGQVAFALDYNLAVMLSLLLDAIDIDIIEILILPSANHIGPVAN
jgi:hypothetical protein